MTCTNCGASLAPDAKFCQRCGTPAAAVPPVDATPEAPVIPPPTPVPPPPPVAAAPPAEVPRPAAAPTPVPTATAAPGPKIGPGVSYTPIQPTKRSTWWIVPLVIVGIVIVAWLLLAGLPFGGDEEVRAVDTRATETIAEGTATAQNDPMNSGTLIEVPGDEPLTTETTAPPMQTDTTGSIGLPTPTPPATATQAPPAAQPPVTQTQRPPVTQTQPPPRTTPTPVPRPNPPVIQPRPQPPQQPRQQPRPITPPPPAPRPAPVQTGEISESEAAGTLSSFVRSNNPYDTRSDCLQIRSHGYRNVGYTFSVWDACVEGGGSQMLGRWRVDSKTREVFRQRGDGRFLRP